MLIESQRAHCHALSSLSGDGDRDCEHERERERDREGEGTERALLLSAGTAELLEDARTPGTERALSAGTAELIGDARTPELIEDLPSASFSRHLDVIYSSPGGAVNFSGGLGGIASRPRELLEDPSTPELLKDLVPSDCRWRAGGIAGCLGLSPGRSMGPPDCRRHGGRSTGSRTPELIEDLLPSDCTRCLGINLTVGWLSGVALLARGLALARTPALCMPWSMLAQKPSSTSSARNCTNLFC